MKVTIQNTNAIKKMRIDVVEHVSGDVEPVPPGQTYNVEFKQFGRVSKLQAVPFGKERVIQVVLLAPGETEEIWLHPGTWINITQFPSP